MTDLQLRYWALEEDKRHNLVWEQETAKHNAANIELGWAENAVHRTQAAASMLQANSAWKRAMDEGRLTDARTGNVNAQTKGQELHNIRQETENWILDKSKYGMVASNYTKPAKDIVDIVDDVQGIVYGYKKMQKISNKSK